jgi:hypothetical protein
MRGAQTSEVQGDQEASVNVLRSLAINAARLIQSRLSRPPEDRCYAAIASVPVERRNKEPEVFSKAASEDCRSLLPKTSTKNSLDAI